MSHGILRKYKFLMDKYKWDIVVIRQIKKKFILIEHCKEKLDEIMDYKISQILQHIFINIYNKNRIVLIIMYYEILA